MKLFGEHIDPACEYCEHGSKTSDGQMILCMRNGVVAPFFHCKRFSYSPLLRIPKKPQPMPKFEAKDFTY